MPSLGAPEIILILLVVLLLFGGGLLLRTLMAVEAFDRGYRAESVLSMLVDPLGSKYPTPESLQQFYDQVESEIRGVPGVRDVAWTDTLPLDFFDEGGFSFEIAGDLEATSRVVDACRIPQIAPSLGGVESLIEQPALMSFYELTTEERLMVGIKDNLIRYSVGIEDADDLIADLAAALEKI